MTDILDDLRDLHKQATTERSHYYVAKCCERSIAEIERLRVALRCFAGMPENGYAETSVADDSPVTIRCQLGDIRRAQAALTTPVK